MGIGTKKGFFKKEEYTTINISKEEPSGINRGIDFRKKTLDTQRKYKKKYCLSIGINLYENWTRLNNATFDAIEIARILKENFDFDTEIMLDEAATKPNIEEKFIDLLSNQLEEEDLLIVFFAGHGHTIDLSNNQQKGYIVPVEARNNKVSDLISMDTLKEWTYYLKSKHVLYIFDSCFSGTATLRTKISKRNNDFLERKARIVITAGGANQPVVDGGWNNHSVFTGILLEELLNEENFSKEEFTATRLFSSLSSKVPQFSNQTPALGIFPEHEGGDILLHSNSNSFIPSTINLSPPPFLNEEGAGSLQPSKTGAVKCDPKLTENLKYKYVENDVTLFAEKGKQWALIVGAHPSNLLGKYELPTETLDAIDICDWFINPEIYGMIPNERLSFLVNDNASKDRVIESLNLINTSISTEDSLLFYFSGHVIGRGRIPQIVLSNVESGRNLSGLKNGELIDGLIDLDYLLKTLNNMPAKKVVCIFDPGGVELYESIPELNEGRYILASGSGWTNLRNSLFTWYIKRIVEKFGKRTSLNQLIGILEEANQTLKEIDNNQFHPYLIDKDTFKSIDLYDSKINAGD